MLGTNPGGPSVPPDEGGLSYERPRQSAQDSRAPDGSAAGTGQTCAEHPEAQVVGTASEQTISKTELCPIST